MRAGAFPGAPEELDSAFCRDGFGENKDPGAPWDPGGDSADCCHSLMLCLFSLSLLSPWWSPWLVVRPHLCGRTKNHPPPHACKVPSTSVRGASLLKNSLSLPGFPFPWLWKGEAGRDSRERAPWGPRPMRAPGNLLSGIAGLSYPDLSRLQERTRGAWLLLLPRAECADLSS